MSKLAYFKIPFTKIRVSTVLPIIILALLWMDFSAYSFFVLFCAATHEVGHVIALKLCGAEIYGITLLPFGAVIRSDAESLPYKKEMCVALSGPFFNILLSILFLLLYIVTGHEHLLFLIVCNTLLAFVNLVPVKTLDGARALEAILLEKMSYEKAQVCLENVSTLAFAFLTFCSFLLLGFTGCNFSLVMFCVYIFISVYARREI